ncbi:MAG: DNA polymerase IV [Luminiphilus sp.]|nr:DNA polymerase IV [Luminiphilus sp.]
MRKIIHIDADCFFAAIEMRDDPSLANRPFAVGGSAEGRGVLTTCNYPAREFGVRSAMPTSQAYRLCPDLVVAPVNIPKYREVSLQMHEIFEQFTDLIEPLSLDEAYLDVSDSDLFDGSASRIAEAIRQQIKQEINITVSAGVSINKFVAKVASDWNKPDGQKVVTPEEVDAFTAALEVRAIPGVGPVTADKLNRMGFHKCTDLRRAEARALKRRFGSFAQTLIERAHGRDNRPVNTSRVRKSISVEHTYTQDLKNGQPCLDKLPGLLEELRGRIDKGKLSSRIQKAYVKIKFRDFSTTTVERVGTAATLTDYQELLADGLARRDLPVRLLGLGVRLSPDFPEHFEQLPLRMEDHDY